MDNITSIQMVKTLNVSLRTLKRELVELQKKGAIRRVGSNKKGHWTVIVST